LQIRPSQIRPSQIRQFIKPSEMDEWARHSDLTLKSMIGMTYNPFTKTYKLESDVSVNYLCFYQK
jgi:2-polyprenyl-6-hydroxyphenyl methylase/3-demethylubiquinone-9 3-methyltransferase